ncbi:MAG TPA: hypothetical protein VJ011_04100 [Steroidobacteraceae bacterium]|nr:hypothetical protein [Steroidobacteraceae bacterium]
MFEPIQVMKEIDMKTQNTSVTWRAAFERTFAGLILGAAALLVMGGTVAACLQSVPLGA